jgi:outer membrane murein-binding lipoprotein Lpp
MERSRLKISVVFIALGIFIVVILTYVSLLGENHKINRVINSYFSNLKDGVYVETSTSFSSNFQFQDERFSSAVRPLAAAIARLDDDFEAKRLDKQVYQQERKALEARIQAIVDNFNFLLELSLLKYYKLLDHNDYKVELKRSHFWIPFVGDDSVYVSIALKPKEDKEILDVLSSDQSRNSIDSLIIVVREKGTWKIKEFTIADSSVADIYNDLRQSVDLDKYVKVTPNGLRLKDAEINFKNLPPTDKRLLKFSTHKIRKSLDVLSKKAEEST